MKSRLAFDMHEEHEMIGMESWWLSLALALLSWGGKEGRRERLSGQKFVVEAGDRQAASWEIRT